MKPKLSKEQKQRLNNQTILHNSIKHAWSQNAIHTWADVARSISIGSYPLTTKPTWLELRTLIETQQKELLEIFEKETSSHDSGYVSQVSNSDKDKSLAIPRPSETSVLASPDSQVQSKTLRDVGKDGLSVGETELLLDEKNDYGWVRSPNEDQKAWLSWYQKKAVTQILHKINIKKARAILLLAGTGTGKTYILGSICRRLMDMNFHEGKTFSHIPYVCITRTTVLEQLGRAFKSNFNIEPNVDCEVMNIEQLRSKAGQFWLKKIEHPIEVVRGKEIPEWTEYKWKKGIEPVVIELDESQSVKNDGSTQHQIMAAYNDLPGDHVVIHSSATPFTKVSEAKVFAVGTGLDISHHGLPKGTILTNENWPEYAKIIAGPDCNPDEHNEAAVERLMKDLDQYVVRVKGVRKQFDETNSVEKIDFQSKEARADYDDAWQKFLKEKTKFETGETTEHPFVMLLKFSMAAELIRSEILADRLYKAVQDGFAGVTGLKFKGTMIKVSMFLIEKHGVSRDDISLIWGGGQTALNKKQQAKKKIRENADKLKLAGMDIDQLLKDVELNDVEDRELLNIPESYRLGPQNLKERQKEIDKFQSGKSKYAMFTFRAGGVGLSLHHTDELTAFKCRRKKSGYAVEEDIPKVPVRPRRVYLAPTYSAIELVQGLGRCPRLTSLSPTIQTLLYYRGTIEDDIADIVSQKLRCLTKVVAMREKWADVIVGAVSKEEALATTASVKNDEQGANVEDALAEGESEE